MNLDNSYVMAFCLSTLLTTCMGQTLSTAIPIATASGTPTYRNWTYDIPPDEAAALAAIVEDIPPPVSLPAKRSDDLIEKPPSIVKRKDNLSPTYPLIYRNPLPIPPVKQPLKTITNPVNGKDILYYEVDIKPFEQQIYPDLPQPAALVGYDGIAPGPTFIVPRGTETMVRFINRAELANSVHLHGSYSRAPFDGWAEDVTEPGQYKDYYYPNSQNARMLWYHDHAVHHTAENAYAGQAGAYIITEPEEDALGLPSGYGEYDIPLVLGAKQYNADGSLFSLVNEDVSLWGDVIHVNGQPWPYMDVEPRKYRFRFLNAAVSRSFALYFAATAAVNAALPFKVISSDTGLLSDPVQVSNLYISNGERYEVVFDFTSFAGQAVELRNHPSAGGIGVDDEYLDTDKVMRFIVSSTAVTDPSVVPATLRSVPFPTSNTPDVIDHHFRFHRSNSQWMINNEVFADAANRVLADVPRGTVEIWELENSSDGWTHPVHVHLVDFRVLERRGNRAVMPYEEKGLKDVVWLGKGETVVVEAHYAPWDGVYMFHCHNLIHEDQDMMAAFNVTSLPDFGYPETTHYIDPMEDRWRAKSFAADEFTAHAGVFSDESITASVQDYANANPYSDVVNITNALDEYWLAKQSQIEARGDSDISDDDGSDSDDYLKYWTRKYSDDLKDSREYESEALKDDNSRPIPRYRRSSL